MGMPRNEDATDKQKKQRKNRDRKCRELCCVLSAQPVQGDFNVAQSRQPVESNKVKLFSHTTKTKIATKSETLDCRRSRVKMSE